MRIWKCDKCQVLIESYKKPMGWYDVKLFQKAQSKGGESFGCNLCNKCAKELFNVVKFRKGEKSK